MEQQNSQAMYIYETGCVSLYGRMFVFKCIDEPAREKAESAKCKQLSVYKLEPRQYNKQANILRCDVKWPLKNSSNFVRN